MYTFRTDIKMERGTMEILTRKEELILLAIYKLGDDAYGVTIREFIKERTGISIKFGAIYAPLARLVRLRYVDSNNTDPVPEPGGRSKIVYRLTKDGIDALKRIQEVNSAMWEDMPNLTEKV